MLQRGELRGEECDNRMESLGGRIAFETTRNAPERWAEEGGIMFTVGSG